MKMLQQCLSIQILYLVANAGRGTTERGTRHERTRDETRMNAALRSLVPRPAFAKKYRDCRADALL